MFVGPTILFWHVIFGIPFVTHGQRTFVLGCDDDAGDLVVASEVLDFCKLDRISRVVLECVVVSPKHFNTCLFIQAIRDANVSQDDLSRNSLVLVDVAILYEQPNFDMSSEEVRLVFYLPSRAASITFMSCIN